MGMSSCAWSDRHRGGSAALGFAVALGALYSPHIAAQTGSAAGLQADALHAGFIDPPPGARPRVWWHWMNGNISQEGIREDLEWMKRAGIGGVQNFEASLATPKIVEKRLVYMSPEWQSAFRFATETAKRLDLEFAVASSPGWSETGGPWVEPQDALQKLVWSETPIEGGKSFTGRLAPPP